MTSTRLALTLLVLLAGSATADSPKSLVLKGNGKDLGETPVVVPLDTAPPVGDYLAKPFGGGEALPAQVYRDGEMAYLALIVDHLKGDETRQFALEPTARPSSAGVDIVPAGPNLKVNLDGKPFSEYRTDAGPKPFYYPVIGPTGAPFTRAYPMAELADEDKDHPHQRSFWFTHGKVNGIDFWSELKGHGSIRETARPALVAGGSALGLIRTRDDWLGPDGQKVCEDERTVRVYATRRARIVDFDITINANAGPVTFGDTKEGMFGLRVASSMDVKRKQGGRITNAEGITDADAWGKPSPWVDYVGPVEGKVAGVAILNHPDSFRYPTTWHVRDYGLFAANPFGWHDFGLGKSGDHTIPAGGTLTFRYRVVLHEGDTAAAGLPAAFAGYSSPPRAEFKGD